MIDIEDDAQAEFVFNTIDELQTLLRLKQALFNGKFMGNTENANLAFDQIRTALSDQRYLVFGVGMLPCKDSIND
jgi:hypothetical protein